MNTLPCMSSSKKPHMNLVVTGHVDNGKSTIVGHLMVDLGVIDQRTIEQFAKESEATGKGDTFKYAWVLDSIKDERDRGIKMDDSNYSEARYNEVKGIAEKMLKMVGYNTSKVNFVPVSGWKGDNLAKKSENMGWYKGPTLLEALDSFEPPEKPIGKPLRIPIQDVYSITGVGTVPVGRVETGVVKANDKIIVMPAGVTGEVKSIETHHTQMNSAEAGDNIGFNLRGIDKKSIHRGDVIGHPDKPPSVAKEFEAQIIVIHHPTAMAPGYTPVLHAHTAQVAATLSDFVAKIDPKTGGVLEEKPKFLKTGDAAIVRIRPVRPLAIETFKEFPEIGRFALRDMGTTIAAGVVKAVTEKHDPNKK